MTIENRNLTAGTKLVAKYHKEQHTCQVIQGEGDKVRYKLEDGREFKSPSAAGMAITGHACDGWHFWSVETSPNPAASTAVPEETSPTVPESAPAQEPGDAPTMGPAPTAPESTRTTKNFLRTPNQKGAPEAQTRWYCHECGESFLAPLGEIPSACPQGHQA